MLVTRALELFAELPLRTIIVPGNHDAHDASSVYRRVEHVNWPSVHIIGNPAGEWAEFPELDLAVWGRPTVVHEPAYRPFGIPLKRPRPITDAWHVAVAHGHYMDGESTHSAAPRSSPISHADLAGVDADYVGLGHWDVPTSIGEGITQCWYSGAPVIGGVARTAIGVTLDPLAGVQVEMVQLHATTGSECPSLTT
jgi:DNA repair exonuclease SbcCD nuclease subunit